VLVYNPTNKMQQDLQ